MAKLRNTSESVLHIGIIVLNLDTWLRAELKSLLDALDNLRSRQAETGQKVETSD